MLTSLLVTCFATFLTLNRRHEKMLIWQLLRGVHIDSSARTTLLHIRWLDIVSALMVITTRLLLLCYVAAFAHRVVDITAASLLGLGWRLIIILSKLLWVAWVLNDEGAEIVVLNSVAALRLFLCLMRGIHFKFESDLVSRYSLNYFGFSIKFE